MINALAAVFLLASAQGTADRQSGASQTSAEPSFRCTDALSETETLICGDPELRAYDRAVAYAYSHKWRPSYARWSTQREWLKLRNRCGRDRRCVLDAYREWLAALDGPPLGGSTLRRVAGPPDRGGDLMLGTLQSPTGRVKRLGDDGELFITPLREDWYLFSAYAAHYYDPHDGRGENMSDSEATGVVRIAGGKGIFVEDPTEPDSCRLELSRLTNGRWKLAEAGDSCSGLGSSLSGVYAR